MAENKARKFNNVLVYQGRLLSVIDATIFSTTVRFSSNMKQCNMKHKEARRYVLILRCPYYKTKGAQEWRAGRLDGTGNSIKGLLRSCRHFWFNPLKWVHRTCIICTQFTVDVLPFHVHCMCRWQPWSILCSLVMGWESMEQESSRSDWIRYLTPYHIHKMDHNYM